jgi:drug/metabolite transporter (DMT)-like permease
LVQEFAVAQFIMLRYWLFLVFALGYAHLHGGLAAAARTRHPWLQLLRSLLSVGEIAIFSLGLRYLGLAESHALFAVFPLLAMALAGGYWESSSGCAAGWRRRWALLAPW